MNPRTSVMYTAKSTDQGQTELGASCCRNLSLSICTDVLHTLRTRAIPGEPAALYVTLFVQF
jgi:hypothetical protein